MIADMPQVLARLQALEPKSKLQNLIVTSAGPVTLVFPDHTVRFDSAMEVQTLLDYAARRDELARQAKKEAA